MKDTITGGLSAARRKFAQFNQPELYRIDIDRIAKELDLQNEAKTLAAAGLPLIDQTELSAPEAKAVQRVETARQDFVRWASARLQSLNERLPRRDVAMLVNDALAADKAFERKAANECAEHEALVNDLARTAVLRQEELAQFCARNGLTRPATYPEGSASFARYAVLLALIVVEAVANAYFFSQGLDSGLIGGFLAAGLFAAVNLITAFVLGKFAVPLVFHRHAALTALGVAAIGFAVVWMITVGLAIAQFRDALIVVATEPARGAWIALQTAPFSLRDIMSWLLFSISVLFAVFALFDGLSSDDRYPGYGPVARRARQSRDDYLGELQAIRKHLDDAKADALAGLDRSVHQARALVAGLVTVLREKKWARTQVETALLDAENCLDTLLKIFRDANQMHRAGLQRPAYFESRPALQPLVLPDFGTDDAGRRLDAEQRLVERLLTEIDKVRAGIEASYNAHRDTLKPADQR